MLPDPEKAYDSDPVINSLWSQFILALQRTKRVFVLGHSLNDKALAQAIRDNVRADRIAITVLGAPPQQDVLDPSAAEMLERLKPDFPSALMIPTRFGEMPIHAASIQPWLERTD